MRYRNRPILDYIAENFNLEPSPFGVNNPMVVGPPARFGDRRQQFSFGLPTVSGGTETGTPDACCPVTEVAEPANFSSAVLIANRLVLTASHSAPESCGIRIPAAHFEDGPLINVSKVLRSRDVDLALLVLQDAVAIRPARLAKAADFAAAVSQGIVFCGFGFERNSFGHLSRAGIKRISMSSVPVIATPLPDESEFDPNTQFIAGGKTASGIHDAETGDSGGPGYLADGAANIVVGIVSHNALGHRSILTRIDAALDWIQAVAGAENIVLP